MKSQGFTLVELSIVLVIIGLLIGGILVGQSLIESAKINAIVSKIQQFDVAVVSFKTKYKSIPGDSKTIGVAGNGNGKLEDSNMLNSTHTYIGTFTSEVSNFWTDLSISGFQPDHVVYSNNASSGVKAGINTPTIESMSGKPLAVAFWTDNSSLSVKFGAELYYWLADFSTTTNVIYNHIDPTGTQGAFSALEMLQIDKKLDDGLAVGGNMGPYSNVSGACVNGNDYKTTTTLDCQIFQRVLGDLGGLSI